MGSEEQNAYDELKSIYRNGQAKFERALKKASSDQRTRDAILRQRLRECEAICDFCQELTLSDDRAAASSWLKEANRWLGRKRQLERELDENDDDDDDELPLPDREEGSGGEWRDINYY